MKFHFPKINVLQYLHLCWVLLLLSFRPAILGTDYNRLVLLLFTGVTLLIMYLRKKDGFYFKTKKLTFYCVLLTQLYFLVQGLILSDATKDVVNSSFVVFVTCFCIFFIIRKLESRNFVLQQFIYVHFVIGISFFITLLILLFYRLELPPFLILARLFTYSKGFDDIPSHFLVFPFTFFWSGVTLGSIELPRYVGLYREPGVAQIYFCTAFFMSYFVKLKRKLLIRCVLLTCIFFLFSTAGYLSMMMGFVAFIFFNGEYLNTKLKKIVFVFAIVVTALTTLFLPDAGIFDKVESDSGKVRSESYIRSFSALKQNPLFGKGYFSGYKIDSNGLIASEETIGLIGVAFQIGLTGMAFYLFCWGMAFFYRSKIATACILIPCFITVVLSQPIYTDVIIWFLILLPVSDLKMIKNEAVT